MNGRSIADRVDYVDFGARRVILVLAIGVNFRVGIRGPLPNPVDRQGVASLVGSRNVNISLAPHFHIGAGLTTDFVREAGLALNRDGFTINLMTAAIIIVLSGKLNSARITSIAGSVPLENFCDLLV